MASVVSGASFKEHTSYTLDVLTIVNNESEAFDVKNTFIQCFINESIFDNFLSGEIVIADAIGMFDKVKFTGQESLRIRLSQPTGFNDTIDEDDVIGGNLYFTDEIDQKFPFKYPIPEEKI